MHVLWWEVDRHDVTGITKCADWILPVGSSGPQRTLDVIVTVPVTRCEVTFSSPTNDSIRSYQYFVTFAKRIEEIDAGIVGSR